MKGVVMNNTRSIFLRGYTEIDRVFAYDNSVIPSGAKLVFMCLLSNADRQGICSNTQRQISQSVGISERQVRNHLRKLEQLGVIEKTAKSSVSEYRKPNRYDLSQVIGISAKGGQG